MREENLPYSERCAGRFEKMICEKCHQQINKILEVRWNIPFEYGYHWKQFESMDKLIEWVEKNDGTNVILKVVKRKKNNEGKTR